MVPFLPLPQPIAPGLAGLGRCRDCSERRAAAGGSVLLLYSSPQALRQLQPTLSPPPGALPGWGWLGHCSRWQEVLGRATRLVTVLLPVEKGQQSAALAGRTVLRDSWDGATLSPPSFHLLTPRLSSPSSDPATINTAWGRVHTYQALCSSQGSGTQIPSPHCSPSDLRKRALCPVTGHRNIVFSGGEEAKGWSREWGLLAWPTLLTSTHAQFCLLKNIYVYWNIVDSMLC